MTIEEIQKHNFYTGLSQNQKTYVVARCLGKSKIDAAKESWTCANDESAAASANRAERNRNIEWLIKEFQGGNLPTREETIKLAWEIARTASDTSHKINALKLVSSLSGFENPPAPPPTVPQEKKDDGEELFDDEG